MSDEPLSPSETAAAGKRPLARTVLKELRGYAEALLLALLITTFLFTTVGVAGSSMEPTLDGHSLLTGDRLFIPKYETWLRRLGLMGPYERGSIVVYREPADSPYVGSRRDFLVKRVIGLPGDRVRIQDGVVYVNGTALDSGYISGGHVSLGSSDLAEVTVPEGHYFMMGDNRTNSVDSRIYGPVPFLSIAGRATAVIWPPLRDGELNWHALRPPETFEAVPEQRLQGR